MIRHCDGNDPNLTRKAGDSYEPCACGLRFDDVERLTVWPHKPVGGGPLFTPEQVAEFRAGLEGARSRPYELRPMPPRWPTPDELRDFLRENVTVVKPGETLVIQVGENWTPGQVREMTDFLNWRDEKGPILPFRCLVVPGAGLGVVEAEPES